MKLLRAEINGLRYLKFAEITKIEIDFKSPVFIVVGTNGSGKSSLLKELNPLPSVRTDYHPTGGKVLHIEHQGKLYVLSSDFTNKTAPHSFREDDVELNISGTTAIQQELVEKYFNMTPLVRNLLRGSIAVCNINRGDRKNLFLTTNPIDLSVVLDSHKKSITQIRDLKSNIARLRGRQVEIEASLIPREGLDAHRVTKTDLENKSLQMDKLIYHLDQHISSIKDTHSSILNDYEIIKADGGRVLNIEAVSDDCREIIRLSHQFTPVLRGEAGKLEMSNLRTKQEIVDAEIANLKHQLAELVSEVDEYHKHLEKVSDKPLSALATEITEITQAISDIEIDLELVIPIGDIPAVRECLEKIHNGLFVFRDSPVKLLDADILTRLTNLRSRKHMQLQNYRADESRYRDELEALHNEKANMVSKAAIPPECTIDSCGLRGIYVRRSADIAEKTNKAESILKHLGNSIKILSKHIDFLTSLLTPQQDLIPVYRDLHRCILNDTIYLQRYFPGDALLRRLNTQPITILSQLESIIATSEAAYRKNILLEKKHQLETELNTVMKSDVVSSDFIKNLVVEKEAKIAEKRGVFRQLEHQENDIKKMSELYLKYADASLRLRNHEIHYADAEQMLLVTNAIKYWDTLKQECIHMKLAIQEELRTLDTIVREQELLRSRYDEEIIKQLDTLTFQKKKIEVLEKALSPSTGIPHKRMVRYLNTLIEHVNYFVAQVYTYKLQILPLSGDKELDYMFPIEVGDTVVPDLSDLSRGQKEVVNFAWTLTILAQLKLLNQIPLNVDELGSNFDKTHKQHLLEFLKQLIDSGLVSQMFLVNHEALFSEGFSDSNVLVLKEENIDLPQEYNTHVTIN